MTDAEVYSQIATHGAAAIIPRAKFKLTGGDRVRYLNGQVSNDVRKLTPQAAMPACVMTAKGSMCADVFISAGGDYLLVDADPALREDLAARLERYIISDDVALEDVTDSLTLIHILPPASAALPESILKPEYAPRASRRLGRSGFDCFIPTETHAPAWQSLSSQLSTLNPQLLDSLRIEARIPRWGFELSEKTIPVEARLDATAIDYHKGCYIGQEVISRLKSIGHVNKLLHIFVSGDGAPLTPGMRLHVPGNPAQEAGWLTSVAYSFALEKPIALGYLKRGIQADALNIVSPGDASGHETGSVLVKEPPLIP